MGAITERIRRLQRNDKAIPAMAAWLYTAVARPGLARPERQIAAEVAARLPTGTVLDLGSGPGQLAIDIAVRAPESCVIGIDLSREMVRLARMRARGTANVRFVVANAAALPLADESVDFVVSTGAVHHMADAAAVFGECRRVLKPGGEGRVYDGCPEAIEARRQELQEAVGRCWYWIYHKIAETHGAPLRDYEGRIANDLERAGFRGCFDLRLRDIWMEVSFRKPG